MDIGRSSDPPFSINLLRHNDAIVTISQQLTQITQSLQSVLPTLTHHPPTPPAHDPLISTYSSAQNRLPSHTTLSSQSGQPGQDAAPAPSTNPYGPSRPLPNGVSTPEPAKSQSTTSSPGRSETDLLPASYRDTANMIVVPSIDPEFFRSELSVDRLNKIHQYLWLVGRPMPPRPLHYQSIVSREIYVDERMEMHLVWTGGRIHLKPVPRYLLDPGVWRKHFLCAGQNCKPAESVTSEAEASPYCENCQLRRCALGFLLTYTSLISYEHDFSLAKDHHLLPSEVQWQDWKVFVKELLAHDRIYRRVNPRFIYGELRLSRLNKIYRVRHLAILRGYIAGYNQYADFFRDNFTILTSATVYIALVLTAMQVGLATGRLGDNPAFMAASYGFTVFAILGPLAAAGLIVVVFFTFFVTNWLSTVSFAKERMKKLGFKPEPVKKNGKSSAT